MNAERRYGLTGRGRLALALNRLARAWDDVPGTALIV